MNELPSNILTAMESIIKDRHLIDEHFTPKEKIGLVAGALLEMEQAPTELTHHFSLDVYGRELMLPAGTLAVGKIHKYPCINILLEGTISLYTEERGVETFSAPRVMVTSPGEQKVGYAHNQCKWMTVHATESKNPDEIVDEITTEDYDGVPVIDESRLALTGSRPDSDYLKNKQEIE